MERCFVIIRSTGGCLFDYQVPIPAALRAGVQGVQVIHRTLLGQPPTPHRGFESNAAAFVLRPNCGVSQLAGRGGPPLGAVDGFPYHFERRQLAPGEMLVLYSDGITKARNPQHSLYGHARLEQLLSRATVTSAGELIDLVQGDVRRFLDGAEQADDITLLALRWLGPRASA